ncbi:MAG: FecR domain-containing protein, partial [Nitrospirae bacterium]|nr:FecR domain-containing protein [Nitrospirota bacterium]
MFKWHLIPLFITLIISLSTAAFAEENIGKILALKGKAVVERDKKKITAKKNQGLLLKDTVSTMKASRLKMRFVDDSILTLGESSRVAIKEYIYSKDKGGKSIFNLLDGKMRSIVGKARFEIHTPTAVAAARGTIILSEVGRLAGKLFATFICLEGEVEVMSADPSIPGK